MAALPIMSAFTVLATYPAQLPCNYRLQISLSDSFTFYNVAGFLTVVIIVCAVAFALSRLALKRYKVTHAGLPGNAVLNPVPLTAVSLILGMGLGGFFDGIVFHQILQWHSMLSNRVPQTSPSAAAVNMFWDGLFHFIMLLIVGMGSAMMLKLNSRNDINFSLRLFGGGLLSGWGFFNLVEGIINHHLFKLHNVKESTPQPGLYNAGFILASIALILIGGYLLKTTGAKQSGPL